MTFVCDVTDENGVYEITAKAEKTFGKIDILVNNAALWRYFASFIDTPTEEWKRFIDVNVMGVVYFTKSVLSKMLENSYGRIINVGSAAGVYGNANLICFLASDEASYISGQTIQIDSCRKKQ